MLTEIVADAVHHKQNFIALICDELRAIGEDLEVSAPEAYSRMVLKTLGYEFMSDQYSDGSREYGIDYWDSSEEGSTIFQFKSCNIPHDIEKLGKVEPSDLTDLPRIHKFISSLNGDISIKNASIKAFIDRLRYNVQRHIENLSKQKEPYDITIYLAVLAFSFTDQAKIEFERQCNESIVQLTDLIIKLSYKAILLNDLINEKWRKTNTQWRDLNGNKSDHINLTVCDQQCISEPKSTMFFTKAIDLVNAYKCFGYQIFEPNVRCEVPRSEVNKKIRASVHSHRGRKEFRHLNNGITMICSGFKKSGSPPEVIGLTQPGIINGLQTVKAIFDAYEELDINEKNEFEKDCSVMVRLHMRNAVGDYRDLVKSTNNQNPMQPRNLRSNDSEQIAFEKLFSEFNWFYERKQGAWEAFKSNPRLWNTLSNKSADDFKIYPRRYRTVDNEALAQCWLAFIGYSNEAVHNRIDIFQKDEMYELIFLSRPQKHGADLEFTYNLKGIKEITKSGAPPPELMLTSWLLREVLKKLVPAAQENRDNACKRLSITGKTREEQDMKLQEDTEYLRNVILRAWSLLFVEFVGLILFRSFSKDVYAIGNRLLKNESMKIICSMQDFDTIKERIADESFSENDFLPVIWNLFVYIADGLVNSSWIESWKQAPNRTRFNYSIDTRKRLRSELEQIDKFLQKSQLARSWAVGLNNSKGVFNFAKNCLTRSE